MTNESAKGESKQVPAVSIVIPCLNESASIGECVGAARQWMERSGTPAEIIVVDNGSTDDTAAVASAAGAKVIVDDQRGKGHAVRTGIAASSGRLLVMSDGDGTYDLSDLDPLLAPLQDGVDMVLGDRLRGEIAEGAMPWHHRYIGNPFFNLLITLVTRRKFGDCLTGLRSFTRSAWDAMSPVSAGFELESEMCILAARLGLRVTTVPIHYQPRKTPAKLKSLEHGFKIAAFIVKRAL